MCNVGNVDKDQSPKNKKHPFILFLGYVSQSSKNLLLNSKEWREMITEKNSILR